MTRGGHPTGREPDERRTLGLEASLTLVAALFAFLALDDITTDNATTGFKPEFRLLASCGVWLLWFAAQLWRKHRRALAVVSLVLLGAAAWVTQDGLGHKNAGGWSVFWPEYCVVTAAWLWFTVVAAVLLVEAFRRTEGERATPGPRAEAGEGGGSRLMDRAKCHSVLALRVAARVAQVDRATVS